MANPLTPPAFLGTAGPGSVKYERSWGIEESLEQFQGLVRQHPGGLSWVIPKCFPNIVINRMIIHAYIVRLSYIIYEYTNMIFHFNIFHMTWFYHIYSLQNLHMSCFFLLQRNISTSACFLWIHVFPLSAPRHELQSSVGQSHVTVRKMHTEFCTLSAVPSASPSRQIENGWVHTSESESLRLFVWLF